MKKIAILIDCFSTSISQINESNDNELSKIDQKIAVSRDCLSELRNIIRNDKFPSPKDEITYFKSQKPLILGKLGYYRKQKEFLLEKPIISISKQKESILNELNRMDCENVKSFEFIKYYRLNQDELDHLFFLRGNNFEMFLISPHQNHDPEFSTQHDYMVANIITNDLLLKFYNKQIQHLNRNDSNIVAEEILPPSICGITWTATVTELIELTKGLETIGAINNGNIDMKKVSEACKIIFGVDIGNYSKTYSQIKERKKDVTKFIDKLKMALQNRIDLENRNF